MTTAELEALRGALVGHCYRMLGSAAEADERARRPRHEGDARDTEARRADCGAAPLP
jgi:hypothetical protein